MECAAIALVVVGVVMATVTDSSVTTNLMGVVLSIAAILFSALYQVHSRRTCLPADSFVGPASLHPSHAASGFPGIPVGGRTCSMEGCLTCRGIEVFVLGFRFGLAPSRRSWRQAACS